MNENDERFPDVKKTIKPKKAWDPIVDEWDQEEYIKLINKKHARKYNKSGSDTRPSSGGIEE